MSKAIASKPYHDIRGRPYNIRRPQLRAPGRIQFVGHQKDQSVMRNKLTLLSAAALGAIIFLNPSARAAGDDFVRESIPNKWVNPFIPEDLDKLDYPNYYKALDKARLEAFTGRYKLSLITINKARDIDPLQVALVKATSQNAIGQKETAVKTLSDPKVADQAPAQVLRARILSELSRHDEAISLLNRVIERNKDSVPAHYY